jgi:hypothetical protein
MEGASALSRFCGSLPVSSGPRLNPTSAALTLISIGNGVEDMLLLIPVKGDDSGDKVVGRNKSSSSSDSVSEDDADSMSES